MVFKNLVVRACSLGAVVLSMGGALGQNYPNKPVRIVTAEVGGGSDMVARPIAQDLTELLGKQVIVDNRGILAIEVGSKAPPDGYTLILYGSPLWLLPFMRDNVPWDPVRDFLPITLAVTTPNILVVHPSLPVKSVRELISLARARPGELNYAAGTVGSSPQLAAELFKFMAGVKIVRVAYKGTASSLTALFSGEVQLLFPSAALVASHIKSGRLRALAVTTAQPSALVPGLPTVAASGLPGYEAVAIYGVFAPAKTPATIINYLNQEIVRVLNKPDVKRRFFNSGTEVVGSSPEQFADAIKSEMARMGKVFRDSGVRE
jgi:tripartite-type tricarboxylate transporter receptor subunit TctC